MGAGGLSKRTEWSAREIMVTPFPNGKSGKATDLTVRTPLAGHKSGPSAGGVHWTICINIHGTYSDGTWYTEANLVEQSLHCPT